jgi:hypothetical protein
MLSRNSGANDTPNTDMHFVNVGITVKCGHLPHPVSLSGNYLIDLGL